MWRARFLKARIWNARAFSQTFDDGGEGETPATGGPSAGIFFIRRVRRR